MPLRLGSEMSSSTRSGRSVSIERDGGLAVAGHRRAVALQLEIEGQPFGDGRVVLHDRDELGGAGLAHVASRKLRGSVMRKRAPWSTSDVTSMRPWCAFTMACTMASPRPEPGPPRSRAAAPR